MSKGVETVAAPAASEPAPELRRLARGGTLNLVGFVLSGLFAFVLAIVVTRLVGARGAGTFFAAVAVFTILSNITELGADTGIVRYVARLREQGRGSELASLMRIALIPAAVFATVAGAATVIWAVPLADVFSRSDPAEVASYLRVFGWCIPLATISTIALAGTRGFGSMRAFVAIDSVSVPALKPILMLVAAIGGVTATGLALGWAIPEALACVVSVVVLWRMVRRARPTQGAAPADEGSLATAFWRFSAPRGVAAAFQITIIWFDLLLLSHFRAASEVGVYGAASRAVTFGTFALQAIRLAIAPQISRLLARGDRTGAQTVYQTATWWLVVASWPVFLVFAVFGPLLLGVFGPGFDQGATALAILSVAMLVNLGTGNVTVVLLMGGKSSWNLVNTAIALALNIGLNLVLIPRYGIEGSAIAWAVSIIVDNVLALLEVWFFLGMRPFGRGYVPAAGAALVCIGGVGVAARAVFGPGAVGFVVFLVVALPLYAVAIWRRREVLRLDELIGAFGPTRSRPGQGGGSGAGQGAGWSGGGGGKGRVVRGGVRRVIRGWCLLTAPLRRPPDLMVIGTKRGGTTSLAAYLYEHPRVLPPVPARLAPKGVRAFDEHPERGALWYRSHFPTFLRRGPAGAPRAVAAESTANYFFHAEQASRAAAFAPNARAIVSLRDPVERAWSHWRERTRRGSETLSFEEALDAEAGRLAAIPSSERANIAYRAQGCYAEFLPAWREAFGERLLVLFAEELYADPPATYARVLAFAGLEPHELARYEAWNFQPSAQPMDPETHASLRSFYEPFDRRLEELVGRSVPWRVGAQGIS